MKEKLKKRDQLSKLDAMECFYRGGFEMGYQQALADVRAVLQPVQDHVHELSVWALGDPTIQRDPPVLTAEAARHG